MVLKLGQFGLQIRNKWKVYKFGDAEDQLDRPCDKCKVLYRLNKETNILQTTKIRNDNWIVYVLRRKCTSRHVIQGKIKGGIEVTEKQA